jgi:bacteriocin biosynthesis cyclodehydratase domain-containing protein
MLELTDPASAQVLDLLDGTRTEAMLLRDAARLAIPAESVELIISALRQAGFVVDAHALHPAGIRSLGEATRRRIEREAAALVLRRSGRYDPSTSPAARMKRRLAAQVLVTGSSQLAIPIARALASAGVGHLDPDVLSAPEETEPPADEALRQIAPEIKLAPIRRGRASFAVLVGLSAPAALTALAHRRLAHLAVCVRDATVVVGPLVRPGLTPCLNCLDLHRADRDPAWRILAPQLHESPDMNHPVASTTVLAGAAYAAEEVLTQIEGGTPRTLGATVEIAGPGDAIRRCWSQHPGCGCGRRQRTRRTQPPAAHP